jgi:hypothetical protein
LILNRTWIFQSQVLQCVWRVCNLDFYIDHWDLITRVAIHHLGQTGKIWLDQGLRLNLR